MDGFPALVRSTVSNLTSEFRSGRTKPSELTGFLLQRIHSTMETNTFITVLSERAMLEARASDDRYAQGCPLSRLDGIPVAWKDLFDIKDTVTTAGSRLMARNPRARSDAAVVTRLSAAGMVTLGKVNTSEFAYSGLGLNPHFGTPRNPNDTNILRAPGGSSSGSAVAVAFGLACVAIGSDTGGSIRVPASFNGVVGLKTSTGLIEKTGMFPLSRTMDSIGPLANTVEDCALIFKQLQGLSPPDIARSCLTDLTLVYPTNHVCDDLQPDVAANFERSLTAMQQAGVRLRREVVPSLSAIAELTEQHGNLVAAEAYAEYAQLVDGEAVVEIDNRVVDRILGGKQMTARDVLIIQRERRRLQAELLAQMKDALLVMPTTPITAPVVAPLELDDDLFHQINRLALRNASLGNALDLCALAIPNGLDSQGLPTSLMLMGPHGADDRLLSFGMGVEQVIRPRHLV